MLCRGLWELHRLTKEAVAEWFIARRAEDGLTSSTQKRQQATRTDRDVLEDAFEGPKIRNNRQLDGSSNAESQARASAGGGKQLIGSYGSSRDLSGLSSGGGSDSGKGAGKGSVEEELLDGFTGLASKQQQAKVAAAMKVRGRVDLVLLCCSIAAVHLFCQLFGLFSTVPDGFRGLF